MEKSEEIKKITEELLSHLGLAAEVGVSLTEGTYEVSLRPRSEAALFIGHHGETLNSLQVVLALMLFRKFGETVPLLVDVDGYRKERLAKLKALAVHYCDKSRFLNIPQELPPMNAFERRIIHLVVSEIADMSSGSTGEGRERRVVIRPKGLEAQTAVASEPAVA